MPRLSLRWTDEQLARISVVMAASLAVFVAIPLFVSNTVIGGDDWAWIWTFHTYGATAVQHYVAASGHPGFGPVLNFLLYFGGADVGRFAHVYAIAFHLATGWLLWRIFRETRLSAAMAATVAILYLATPFLAELHGSWAHALYDSAIFFYVLSIWLSLRPGYVALAAACVAVVIGLSIETLAALEPLRWWALYRMHDRRRAALQAALPYLGMVLLVGLARSFWFVPSGPYAGYNAVVHAGLGSYLRAAVQHLWFFADVGQPIVFTGSLIEHDNPALPWIIFIVACVASASLWRSAAAEKRELIPFFCIAAAILVLGMAPYVLINQVPSRIDVSSRFAVASQFGALLFIAGGIQLLRFAPVRAGALAGLVFVFMSNQLQLGKWLLYEGQVVGNMRQQVGAYLAQNGDQVLTIQFEPASHDFLDLNRACLSAYDTNVSLELAHARHGSFVFDAGCPYRYYGKTDTCMITGFDPPAPCPAEQRDAIYRLKPDLGPFTHFHLADLLQYTLRGQLWDAGDFIPEPPPPGAAAPAPSH